jgi:hypothetical protein
VSAQAVVLSPATQPAIAGATLDSGRWAGLGLSATAQFMVVLDEYPGHPDAGAAWASVSHDAPAEHGCQPALT